MISDGNAAIFNWGSARTKNNTAIVATGLSVQEVINSITDATSDKPYVIIVPPGVYTEQITMKQYVSLKGESVSGSIITNATGPVLTMASNVDIADITIKYTDASSYCIDTGTASIEWNIDNCYLEALTGGGVNFRSTGVNSVFWRQSINDTKIKANKFGINCSAGYGYLNIYNTRIQLVGQSSGNNHIGIEVGAGQRLIVCGGQIYSAWTIEQINEPANDVYGLNVITSGTAAPRIHLNATEIMVRNESATNVNAIKSIGAGTAYIRIRGGMYQSEDSTSALSIPVLCTGNNKVEIIGAQLSGYWSAPMVKGDNIIGEYYVNEIRKTYHRQSDFYLSDPNGEPVFTIENNNTTYSPQLKFKKDTSVFSMGIDTGNADRFKIYSGDGIMTTYEFVIKDDGNIGMGTLNPVAKLEVAGTLLYQDYCADPNGTGDRTITLSSSRGGTLTDRDLTGNADFILYNANVVLSMRILIVNGTYNISVVPPTGGKLWMDGTALDANDEIDLSSNEGDKFNLTRRYSASGSAWVWDLETVRGTASDGGPGD
uniref:Pectate lyase n=1 Tax=viral metagenome TaxID=1070528 RepID=A0A6M3L769_9ZZZZ